VLKRISGPKRNEIIRNWWKLHNEEFRNSYSLPNINITIKSRRMKWAGHVASMRKQRNAYRILMGKPEGTRPVGRSIRRLEDNIEMDHRDE
jgi:hypothetical protein